MNTHGAPVRSLATLQLIIASLVVGVLIFLGVAMTIGPAGQSGGTPPLMLLRAVWAALLASGVAAAVIFPRLSIRLSQQEPGLSEPRTGPGRESDDENVEEAAVRIFPRFFVSSIIVGAIFEGPALLATVIYLLSGQSIDLGLAIVPLLALIATFPTRNRFERFIDRVRGWSSFTSTETPNEYRQYRDPTR